MAELAFHRTTFENAKAILQNGVLSMSSQGYTLPDADAPNYSEARTQLMDMGFKFRIPSLERMNKRTLADARWITEKTFVRVGGVEQCWNPQGVNVAIDMDRLDATGLTIWEDSYGMNGDLEIHGDIPASCVIGIVSDEWMIENGYKVESGN